MKNPWWKEAVFYQIYPRSFKDSNHDGIGDIRGIIEKADYLSYLGINAVWLNPVYESPNVDNGYDVSNYRDIMNDFGTMSDFDELIDTLHQKNIRLIMDLVVNHTSDQHPWFIEASKSQDNPYHDYYIWKDPKENDEKLPNNWQSCFGGKAWEWNETVKKYYLHLFAVEQPDLNWENPHVRNEVYQLINWWLDEKKIDGFRMDVINFISKYPGFADIDYNRLLSESKGFVNGPNVHRYIREMNQQCFKGKNKVTVGESFHTLPDEGKKYINPDNEELNMIFQMEHVSLGEGVRKWDVEPWKLSSLKNIFKKWNNAAESCGGWMPVFLANHDQPRAVSKFGDDQEYRKESAKMLGIMMLTLKGTPFIYQGQELGMTNVSFDDIEDYRDVEIKNFYRESVEAGKNLKEILKPVHIKGRDNSRTPMQWNNNKNAGFSDAEPWIKVNPNYTEINADKEISKPDSVFHFYRFLIDYRKNHPALIDGSYEPLLEENENLFVYQRKSSSESFLIILNFTEYHQTLALSDLPEKQYELIRSNYLNSSFSGNDDLSIKPYEGMILKY